MKIKINYKENGITLVALVITIIILLILAGVTINTALSENGLFRMAKKAVNEYQEAEKKEQLALDDIAEELDKISIDYNDYVGCYVEGYEPTKKEEDDPFVIKSATSGMDTNKDNDGNTIDSVETDGSQRFTTEELGWRIWDYDKYTKTIRLISDKPTNANLTLKGATGYNNGIWAINEICRQCYGTGENGVSAANLRRSDIQKVSTYDYTQYKRKDNEFLETTENTGNLIHFGETKTYDTNNKYPKIWGEYDSKWTYEYNNGSGTGNDKECEMWERENGYETVDGEGTGISKPTFKESYYSHRYEEAEFINKEYYNLLFWAEKAGNYLKKYYWLAGRYVRLQNNNSDLGLNVTGASDSDSEYSIGGNTLFASSRYYV